jgi:predicted nuclease of predicted toxin-antitoxin system
MRLLTDQDIYHFTIEWLKKEGYDVITASELGMSRASDEKLLDKAKELNRIFVTRDKDFGALVFLKNKESCGVILLRSAPEDIEETQAELKSLFEEYEEKELHNLFCVVEPSQYRIRHLPHIKTS